MYDVLQMVHNILIWNVLFQIYNDTEFLLHVEFGLDIMCTEHLTDPVNSCFMYGVLFSGSYCFPVRCMFGWVFDMITGLSIRMKSFCLSVSVKFVISQCLHSLISRYHLYMNLIFYWFELDSTEMLHGVICNSMQVFDRLCCGILLFFFVCDKMHRKRCVCFSLFPLWMVDVIKCCWGFSFPCGQSHYRLIWTSKSVWGRNYLWLFLF